MARAGIAGRTRRVRARPGRANEAASATATTYDRRQHSQPSSLAPAIFKRSALHRPLLANHCDVPVDDSRELADVFVVQPDTSVARHVADTRRDTGPVDVVPRGDASGLTVNLDSLQPETPWPPIGVGRPVPLSELEPAGWRRSPWHPDGASARELDDATSNDPIESGICPQAPAGRRASLSQGCRRSAVCSWTSRSRCWKRRTPTGDLWELDVCQRERALCVTCHRT